MKWASSWDYGTYHIGDQWRLRRACATAQSHQSLCCSHMVKSHSHSLFLGVVLLWSSPACKQGFVSEKKYLSWNNWAMSLENLFMPYANNKGADQPAHPRSLINVFLVRCLDGIIPLLAIAEISRLELVSAAEQTGLSLIWSQTPKTGFIVTWLNSWWSVLLTTWYFYSL